MKHKIALLAALTCPAAFAQSASDLFLDVTTYDQVSALSSSAELNFTGVFGSFKPQSFCAIGIICGWGDGQVHMDNTWQMKMYRVAVKGRPAVLIQFPSDSSSPYQRFTYSEQWIIRQGGNYYTNAMFYGGGGVNTQYAQIYYEWGSATPKGVRNFGGVNTFILTQNPEAGAQYDPSKAFDVLFIGAGIPGNNLANAPLVATMPAAPAVTASISPSNLTQGGSYTISLNTTAASSVNMVCTGAAAANETFPGGTYSVTRVATEVGPTSCTFKAITPGGIATASASRTVQAPPASPTPPNVPPPRNPCKTNPAACA